MRDEELREQISSWKSKWEEANEKLEDTNTKISEYQIYLTIKMLVKMSELHSKF